MPAIVRTAACALLLAASAWSAAHAVGLGPLVKSGITASDRKGFYLTLINPYPNQQQFQLYAVSLETEEPAKRVLIPVASPMLGGKSQRRLLVIATDLQPGEEYKFRVCAERAQPVGEGLINARVCSKLSARRLA